MRRITLRVHMTKAPKARTATGRPRLHDDVMPTLQVRLPRAILEAIEAECASRLDAPDRSTVIRELLAEAITARRARK